MSPREGLPTRHPSQGLVAMETVLEENLWKREWFHSNRVRLAAFHDNGAVFKKPKTVVIESVKRNNYIIKKTAFN